MRVKPPPVARPKPDANARFASAGIGQVLDQSVLRLTGRVDAAGPAALQCHPVHVAAEVVDGWAIDEARLARRKHGFFGIGPDEEHERGLLPLFLPHGTLQTAS